MLLDRLKYKFDQIMARGIYSQLGLLVIICLVLVSLATLAIYIFGSDIECYESPVTSLPQLFWVTFLHTIDPALVAGSTGNLAASLSFLAITVAGLCTMGALIGIISVGIEDRMDELRRGRSKIMERDHLVILGWDNRVPEIVQDLAIAHNVANGRGRKPVIAILAVQDSLEIQEKLEDVDMMGSRLIVRRGSPIDPDDLDIVSACSGRCIIIPVPLSSTGDVKVIKTLLALNNFMHGCLKHVVAELEEKESYDLARSLFPDTNLVCADEIISRIIAQSVLSPGLTEVYQSLLQFSGSEFYSFPVEDAHLALGVMTFGELVLSCPSQVPIGIVTKDGSTYLMPEWDEEVVPGMRVITLSEECTGLDLSVDRQVRIPSPGELPAISRETGSVLVFCNRNKKLSYIRAYLEGRGFGIEVRSYPNSVARQDYGHDALILLADDDLPPHASDANIITLLLKLRRLGLRANIVTEILDPRNFELIWTARADDCIASYQLSGYVLTQAAYHSELLEVINMLLSVDSMMIRTRPVSEYMEQGTFQYLTIQAMARNEIALGYFPNATDSPVVNPSKGAIVPCCEGAMAIVLSLS
ncbi:MAG: CASTOR/POLLUX-related putative ion channel [Desulfovermiculus sp.]